MDKFSFKRSWYDAVKDLPEGVRKDIYDCVVRYAFGEDVPELKSIARIAFQFIKGELDSSSQFRNLVNKRWKKSYDTVENTRMIRDEIRSDAEKEEIPTEKVTQKELPEEEKEQEKDIDKSISKKKDPRVVFVESLPQDWREVVEYWLKYKSERRENYKSKQSLEVFYNKLVRDSEQSVSRAKEMIDQSIANNWSGVYSVKERPRYSTSSSDSRAPLPKDYTGYYEPVGHEI